MSNNFARTWSADWRERIADRLTKLGVNGLFEFVNANKFKPLGQLFKMLIQVECSDSVPIAYGQFMIAYFEDAKRHGQIREAIADSLVRRIRQFLPHGWNRGGRNRSKKIELFAHWELPTNIGPVFSLKVIEGLNEAKLPDDWCPIDIDDPLLKRILELAWQESDSGHLSDHDKSEGEMC